MSNRPLLNRVSSGVGYHSCGSSDKADFEKAVSYKNCSVFNLHVSVFLSAVKYISPGKSSSVSLRVLISRWLLVLLILLLAQPRK